MFRDRLTLANLDYLQRAGFRPRAGLDRQPLTVAPPALRRLCHVRKAPEEHVGPLAAEGAAEAPGEALLVGLYGSGIPIAFLVHGRPSAATIKIGVWAAEGHEGGGAGLDLRQADLVSAVRSVYGPVEAKPASPETPAYPHGGLALGMPAPLGLAQEGRALPLDRLVRAVREADWAYLVLAQPVDEGLIATLRLGVLNELQQVQVAAMASPAPTPLAKPYTRMLEALLASAGAGRTAGMWRTGVYLLGDGAGYPRLATLWRAIFASPPGTPEPVQVFDTAEATALAQRWALPDTPGAPGPGAYHRAYEYQSLLTSAQLAAYVHLPRSEDGAATTR